MADTIPCRAGCGRVTRMLGTKLCDWCWEISSRQRDLVRLLQYNGKPHVAETVRVALDEIFDPERVS